MDDEEIALLRTLVATKKIAWTGYGDAFKQVRSVGTREGEPGASFDGGEWVALMCCDLGQFVEFSTLGYPSDVTR